MQKLWIFKDKIVRIYLNGQNSVVGTITEIDESGIFLTPETSSAVSYLGPTVFISFGSVSMIHEDHQWDFLKADGRVPLGI